MIHYIFLIIFCVSLTGLQQMGVFKYGLKVSFILIFLFLALRYDYGNDYMNYFNSFLSLKSINDDFFYFKGNEFGWLYLNYFFKYVFGQFGFNVMTASLAGLTCYTLHNFIVRYMPPNYYTFGMALLLLEPNSILVLSSAMRQSVAVSIFLIGFGFLLKKKYFYYLFCVFLASFFHSSSIVFLSFIFLNVFNWKIYIPYVIIGILMLFYSLYNLSEIFNQINLILENQESFYVSYTSQNFENSKLGLGFAFSLALYIGILIVNRLSNSEERNTITKVIIVMLFFSIIELSVQIGTRLSFYILPIVILVVTLTMARLKYDKKGIYSPVVKPAIFIILIFFAYKNVLFWQSEVYAPFFLKYKTVFSSSLFD